jgi:hypothetical protein
VRFEDGKKWDLKVGKSGKKYGKKWDLKAEQSGI